MTLWEGRLEAAPDPSMLAYTVSIGFDVRLAPDDLAGTRAHVHGLAKAGLLTADEAAVIGTALDRVEVELSGGTFAFAPTDEDIHTAIERRVTELAGDAGAKVHTGRSRNDQVATALRLFTRRGLTQVAERALELQRVLLERAEVAGDAYLPGYTHLQRAQPVPLAHHLLAHGWALARDVDRLLDARRRTDVSPLGAGALAGSSLPLDPDLTADELGFGARFENSLDAVSDRDFVAESLFALALLGIHLSRIGEELVIWSTSEFGFCHLDDSWSTGSSMLPQKKNPDLAELARGKAGRMIGHLAGFLATLKGLPLSYNRDLQEDKEPLFDALDQVRTGLEVMAGALRTLHFDVERMKEAADHPGASATDLAEWLVERGLPFRQAHALIGSLVRDAVERGVPLAELVAAHPGLGQEATALLAPGAALGRRQTAGGAGQVAVNEQMERFRTRLAADTDRI
ncbi:MAG TPA: argininosuccinate lyase [Acidimicrobiales bacterium]|nr:argininosuccinate lyase [Acidimicrobiales bacterium]